MCYVFFSWGWSGREMGKKIGFCFCCVKEEVRVNVVFAGDGMRFLCYV